MRELKERLSEEQEGKKKRKNKSDDWEIKSVEALANEGFIVWDAKPKDEVEQTGPWDVDVRGLDEELALTKRKDAFELKKREIQQLKDLEKLIK